MLSKQRGSYLALLTELKNHGLPELQRIEKKLEQGQPLNTIELEHIAHWVEQTQKLASLEQQVKGQSVWPASKHLSELLHNISQQALKNTQEQ